MDFKTAIWRDPATEDWFARIFPEADAERLATWGLTATNFEPVTVKARALTGPHGLGYLVGLKLSELGLSVDKFSPINLGNQESSADIRALMLAAVAA